MNRRKFDSVDVYFKIEDAFVRAFPLMLAFTAFFIAPIVARWIESR